LSNVQIFSVATPNSGHSILKTNGLPEIEFNKQLTSLVFKRCWVEQMPNDSVFRAFPQPIGK
jgi:hypothetical protein